ncbi:hypothetical protein [Croceicoccus marinus]|uniref:hypothetical protein n=1 Tax=Croceicoccus marinus TaxID=450378 RepID=UPI0012F8C624|nr:hypothetical protein [Croceicoccus marinus]
MKMHLTHAMRLSLWLLFVVASLVATFWVALVVVSGFEIWLNESNASCLSLQLTPLLFPAGLFFALKKSKCSPNLIATFFVVSWGIAAAASGFFNS